MHTPEIDCYNNLALMSPLPCTYHLPAGQGLKSLESINTKSIKGMVVFGSGCSVHERLAWQAPFEEWLKPLMLQGIPTFGICYGHQMIAHMFGGKVEYVNEAQEKQLGLRSIHIKESGPYKEEVGPICVSHNETVSSLPDGFEVFAKSERFPLDGIKHKTLPIWTLQSHPEATEQFFINQSMPLPNSDADYLFGHKIMQTFLEFAAS
jgi:GMP synthase (glutamine-hydrolysing)